MSKITLQDSMQEIAIKMSEGNSGALTAICEILSQGKIIDPQGFGGGLGAILGLDTLEIYGSSIYILWNSQCNRDVREMLMLLRAHQLGFINEDKIKAIAADQERKIKLNKEEMLALNEKVCDRLEQFKRPELVKPKEKLKAKTNQCQK